MSCIRLVFCRSLAFTAFLAVAPLFLIGAQVIHIPPAHRRVLKPDETVLVLTAKKDLVGAILTIDDDQIVVQNKGTISVVPLGDRLIRDVMNQL
jgi:hypothetical protein